MPAHRCLLIPFVCSDCGFEEYRPVWDCGHVRVCLLVLLPAHSVVVLRAHAVVGVLLTPPPPGSEGDVAGGGIEWSRKLKSRPSILRIGASSRVDWVAPGI